MKPEALARLVAGRIDVPLSKPVEMRDNRIHAWSPVLVTKDDGSLWVVAFTERRLTDAWREANPRAVAYMTMQTRWVMDNRRPNTGIVFNPYSDRAFEWSAAGIEQYRKDFPAQ